MSNHLGGCFIGGEIGDGGTYAPQVWNRILEKYKPKTLIDVGCGAGYSLKYFLDRGVDGIGVEGYEEAIKRSPVGGNIVKHDFINGPFIPPSKFDFAWSCEFLEHVEEQYLDNFMQTFKACKYVATTHALPGQPGHHHVNCKNEEYWIDVFSKYGFEYLEQDSLELRKTLIKSDGTPEENGGHVRTSLKVFKKKKIDISIENNIELYSFHSREVVSKSLQYAKNLPPSGFKDPVDFHFYWRVPLDFSRKHVLPLKSAIVTQNLKQCKIILWSNIDLSKEPLLQPLLPYIETRIWDLAQESNGTPIAGTKMLEGLLDDRRCWLGGDIFRLLCLHKYGGVYIDMDVVILRDFEPILDQEFMYQWGSSGTTAVEPVVKQNGAIMRMFAKSKLSIDLLQQWLKTPADPNSTCWGTDLYHHVRKRNSNWEILPCSWFNTEWGFGIPLEPFKKDPYLYSRDLYDGAFTWHWHNKWEDEIEEGSKFEILEKIIEKKFLELTSG